MGGSTRTVGARGMASAHRRDRYTGSAFGQSRVLRSRLRIHASLFSRLRMRGSRFGRLRMPGFTFAPFEDA
eukprot:414800-Rhodomonas_salina.1